MTGAGHLVKTKKDKEQLLDAGTLLHCLWVMLLMIKATETDQAFTDLILNHLIS